MKKLYYLMIIIPIIFTYTIASALSDSNLNYSLKNHASALSSDEQTKIKNTLTACADIMSFDIKNYDYDILFKYVLYTHENFRHLTDISPSSVNSGTDGNDSVSLVNGEYIDFIMEKIFRITPQKPPMSELMNRGFCYNNGYYYYTGGFDVDFSTQILDLVGVYDIGGGVLYVVFTDIYQENGNETYEYSFAVLQNINSEYSVLRLGMGKKLLDENELQKYSPFYTYANPTWKNTAVPQKETADNSLLIPILLFIISVGLVGLICSIIALLRMQKK